jgi:hypothetical protein
MSVMQLTYTEAAPAHFVADFDKVAEALRPFSFEHDGGTWLEPNAPPQLARMQTQLTSMGLASRWLTYR